MKVEKLESAKLATTATLTAGYFIPGGNEDDKPVPPTPSPHASPTKDGSLLFWDEAKTSPRPESSPTSNHTA